MRRVLGSKRWAVGLGAVVALVAGCRGGGGSNGGSSASTANVAPNTSGSQVGTPGQNTLAQGVANHTATPLPSGNVLIAGGIDAAGFATNVTEIVTPTGAVTLGPTLHSPRFGHTATILSNGMILIAGGQSGSSTAGANASQTLNTTELYDPATNQIIPGPNMSSPRVNHVAVAFGPIGSQQVLLAGGQNGSAILGSAELYNVSSNVFAPITANLNQARTSAGGGLMDNGTVVIAGGSTVSGPATTAEVFSPTAGTFTATPVSAPATGAAFASTGSEAVMAGGQSASALAVNTTMVFEVASQAFSAGPLLSVARMNATATPVNSSGQLVVIGGRNGASPVANVDVFSGPTIQGSTVSPGNALQTARYAHTATFLGNGSILVVGGFGPQGAPLTSVEIVTPALSTAPGSTVAGATPPPGAVPMNITPVPSTSVVPSNVNTTMGSSGSSGLGSLLGGLFGGSSGSSGTGSIITGILGSLLGGSGSPLSGLLGGSTSVGAGLNPAITSCSPTSGANGTMVVIQATGIGAYLSVAFVDATGSPHFLTSANCVAYQNGSSVQVSLTVPSSLPAGTYQIDLISSSYQTAGSPAAAAGVSFTVN